MIPMVFEHAGEGIAWEEKSLDVGRASLNLWRAEDNAIIVPKAWEQRENFQEIGVEVARNGCPIYARPGGVGALPQGACMLNLALIAPVKPDLKPDDCIREVCSAISEALNRFEVLTDFDHVNGASGDSAWNVTAAGKKLAGVTQRWSEKDGRKTVLIQAAIMVERPSDDVWAIFEKIQHMAGPPFVSRPEAHVALNELLSAKMRIQSVYGALVRAAEDRLPRILTNHQQAA